MTALPLDEAALRAMSGGGFFSTAWSDFKTMLQDSADQSPFEASTDPGLEPD